MVLGRLPKNTSNRFTSLLFNFTIVNDLRPTEAYLERAIVHENNVLKVTSYQWRR